MLKSPITPIFLTVFVDVLGLTMLMPLLPFYAKAFGATPIVIGLLGASYALCQLISGPILGRVSDHVGRKPTLLASQMGTFIGFSVIGLSGSLWMLFLGRIIDGFTAGNLSIAQAYIADVTTPENRTKAFGLIGVAFGAGFLFGPAMSGLLAHRFGYATPAFVAAGLSFTSILLTWRLLPANPARPVSEAAPAPPPMRRTLDLGQYFRRPLPRRRLLEFLAFTLSFSTLIAGLTLFLEARFGYDVEQVGYVYAFSGLIGGAVQGGIIGRLAKRFGEGRLAWFGFMSMGVGYCLLGLAHSLPVLLVLVAVGSIGMSVTRPALTTMLTKSVARNETGGVLGASQSLASLSTMAAWLIAGGLIEHEHLVLYGLAAGTFALAGAALRSMPEPAVPADEAASASAA